jgi:D-alanine-D-alanine ligase
MIIGLVYDLREDYVRAGLDVESVAEFDSPETIQALCETLRAMGHEPEQIGNGRALARALADGRRWEAVFNIAEGLRGRCREAQVPALLEMYDIPYTFSDPLVCALTLDKALAKRLIREAGLATPAFTVVREADEVEKVALPYPLFVKPLAEGTSRGIDSASRVTDAAALRGTCARLLFQGMGPLLVETYLPGREFTVGIVGSGSGAKAIGSMEILIRPEAGTRDYSFEVKERCEVLVEYATPPPSPLRRAVEALAVGAYRALQARDAGRVDIRLDAEGNPSFIEINPLPGLHPTHSDLPMIAARAGWSYSELIAAIMEGVVQRRVPVVRAA